jgi:hypothetical protein
MILKLEIKKIYKIIKNILSMQRLSKKLSLTAIVLALAPCANTNQTIENKLDSFYSKKEVLEEKSEGSSRITRTDYTFTNGLEVEFYEKKSSKSKETSIIVRKDPYNLLIKNTPKTDSAENTIYNIDERGVKHLIFRFNNSQIIASFAEEDKKTIISYKFDSHGSQILPDFFFSSVLAKFKQIEEELHVYELCNLKRKQF